MIQLQTDKRACSETEVKMLQYVFKCRSNYAKKSRKRFFAFFGFQKNLPASKILSLHPKKFFFRYHVTFWICSRKHPDLKVFPESSYSKTGHAIQKFKEFWIQGTSTIKELSLFFIAGKTSLQQMPVMFTSISESHFKLIASFSPLT